MYLSGVDLSQRPTVKISEVPYPEGHSTGKRLDKMATGRKWPLAKQGTRGSDSETPGESRMSLRMDDTEEVMSELDRLISESDSELLNPSYFRKRGMSWSEWQIRENLTHDFNDVSY